MKIVECERSKSSCCDSSNWQRRIMSSTEADGSLDELLEGPVDGRPDVGDVLPEVNSGDGPLGDAFGGELELL